MDKDEGAERLERETDRLEEESGRVGDRIDEAKRDWEAKERDPRVPGAQPDPDEESEEDPAAEEGGP